MFDVSKLTLGEVAKVEELSHLPITVMGDDERPKGLLTAAIAFVIKRRSSPEFTWNDALALTLDQANDIVGISDDQDVDGDELETVEDPT